MSKEQATYSHGHHSSVVTSHARRTPSDSAGFLLPHLRATDRILDLGCGPGSISIGLARLVPEGSVVGLDPVASVLEQARAAASAEGVSNISFSVGDGNSLPFSDGGFDVVFAHQVLQHVKDPVAILREMRRVARPGGIVAARDADYATFGWYPEHAAVQRWSELYLKQGKVNGGEPNAGRMIHVWAREAGFEVGAITNTVSSWCYTGQKATEWGLSWSERVVHSKFAETLVGHGLATEAEVKGLSEGWKDWVTKEDLWFSIPSGEMLYRVPS